MEIEFLGFSIFIIFIYIFEFLINGFIIYMFVKVIVEAFKRTKNHNYFKNNVILYKDVMKRSNSKYPKEYTDVSKNELARFNTDDLNGLKNYFYDIFYRFEVAYNNLDYGTMKMLSTKQLYQNYYTGMTLDLKAGKKKIIDRINREKVIVFELDSTSMKQTASVLIEINYYNYTVDKRGYVVKGNKDYPVKEKFVVVFRKDFNQKDATNCPNCGARLKDGKCSYCKSVLLEEEFKISSIKRVID